MAAVLANTLQCSFLENPLPDREDWQAPGYGVAELDTTEGTLRAQTQDFFCLWQLCPCEVECEGGAAAWLVGTLVAPSVQGHGLPLLQEL